MYDMRRLGLIILGFLIIFMGIAPFLVTSGYMPSVLSFIPVSGTAYNVIIVVLGILVILCARRSY